jgi:hypothetical protein
VQEIVFGGPSVVGLDDLPWVVVGRDGITP